MSIFSGYLLIRNATQVVTCSGFAVTEYNKGVLNTMKATRESTYEKLYEPVQNLLDEMFHMGITTVEGKTGYGLEKWTEIRQLRIMDELRDEHPVDIISTFMGAHAIPPEYEGRSDKYVDYIIEDILPEVHNEHTAKFFDVFCEPEIFSIKQCERLLKAGRSHRFKLKVHADEFTSSGGAELAVKMKAFSADHLINISDNGIKSLAQSDVIATLLLLRLSLPEDLTHLHAN